MCVYFVYMYNVTYVREKEIERELTVKASILRTLYNDKPFC